MGKRSTYMVRRSKDRQLSQQNSNSTKSVCVHGADEIRQYYHSPFGRRYQLEEPIDETKTYAGERVTATKSTTGSEATANGTRRTRQNSNESRRFALARWATTKRQAQAIREVGALTAELHALRSARGTAPAGHTPQPDAEVSKKALTIATIRAMGYQASEDRFSDQQLTAADDLGKIGFFEIAERAAGASPFSFHKDPFTSIRASISTSNLGSVLSSSGSAVLEHLTGRLNTQWKQVFKVGDLDDYKETDRFSLEDTFELKKVPTGGEMEHGESPMKSTRSKLRTTVVSTRSQRSTL